MNRQLEKKKGVLSMLINVTGRQLEITPAIQTQAENVLAVLDIPALKVSSVNAVMSREKNRFQVSLPVMECLQSPETMNAIGDGANGVRFLRIWDLPSLRTLGRT